MFLPYHKPGEYNLLYAPSNAYMFIKFFHALYERLSYAKILVREKIEADLAEMTLQEKVDLGLMNNAEER